MSIPSENLQDVSYIYKSFYLRCNDSTLKVIISDTKKLNADLIEVALLETLILCRKGDENSIF